MGLAREHVINLKGKKGGERSGAPLNSTGYHTKGLVMSDAHGTASASNW
jgi:hypothetical protein